MAIDGTDGDGVREFRLEGPGLLLVGGGLALALTAAFFAGRWYERGDEPPTFASGGGADPLANVVEAEEPADLDGSADFFDTMDGGGKEAEPSREVAGRSASAEPAPAGGAAEAKPDRGPFYVQVFAGRDRGAAEGLVERLQQAHYSVKLFTERNGTDALFKVRVGGYASEDEARSDAQQLVKQGYGGAWVTRVE